MAVKAKKSPRMQLIDNDGNILGGSADKPVHVSTGGAITSEVNDGRQIVTIPGTAVALATSTVCKRVTVVAEFSNTGTITVGSSTVIDAEATRRGIPLYPGDSYTLDVDDLDEVFIDAEVATDGVSYTFTM
jgi:hypothetical protein